MSYVHETFVLSVLFYKIRRSFMTLEELTSALVAQTYVAAEGWYYLMTGLMVAPGLGIVHIRVEHIG